ncbi:MAG: hypothetical protein ACLTMA_10640 [Gemmiger formicilis]|uniref:hypothetical protein n=1 Tax=Gemmiger formicilis TaxID=745368 RepID=UPI003A1B34C4
MTAIEFLRRYRPGSLVKSSARGEYQLAEHDSFKINGESSVWHWKSRDIGGKSALKYLIYVEGVPFVEAVQLLWRKARCTSQCSMKRWSASAHRSVCRTRAE